MDFTYPLSRSRIQLHALSKARLLELTATPDELQRVIAFPVKGGALAACGLPFVALPPPPSTLLTSLARSFTCHGQRPAPVEPLVVTRNPCRGWVEVVLIRGNQAVTIESIGEFIQVPPGM